MTREELKALYERMVEFNKAYTRAQRDYTSGNTFESDLAYSQAEHWYYAARLVYGKAKEQFIAEAGE